MTMSVTLERAERHVATALSESRLCPAGLVGTIPHHHIVFPGWTVHASRALARMRTSRSIQGHEEGHAGLRRFGEEPEEGRGDRTRGEEKPQSPCQKREHVRSVCGTLRVGESRSRVRLGSVHSLPCCLGWK